ncbi:hypothetical protein ACF1AU_32065 [Streptomyces rubrogriseus]|uniref:hypothetical protein n=1 Tax=Streptomyces rubrogriseus TaxID=194673 RepID=UPI0036F7790F
MASPPALPRTGELLYPVKFLVQPLVTASEVQRELICDGLRAAEAKDRKGARRPAERAALDHGVTVRRGQGYIPRVPAVHRRFPTRCQRLDGGQGVPAVPTQRKARREYENRVGTLASYQ